jgi:serine/threonine-protein kinase RsbT
VDAERLSDDVHLSIASDADIVAARQIGRSLAARAGCSSTDLTVVATAISEITRNIVTHARRGHVRMQLVTKKGWRGVMIAATDRGPGIADVDRALEDGFTTGTGLGLGLPGARRLMDEFHIESTPGKGTTVVMHKWCAVDD